jgi:hypothetical protein
MKQQNIDGMFGICKAHDNKVTCNRKESPCCEHVFTVPEQGYETDNKDYNCYPVVYKAPVQKNIYNGTGKGVDNILERKVSYTI